MEANARWGRTHLRHLNLFCGMEGSRKPLPFPDKTFDAFFANGALSSLKTKKEQCDFLTGEVMRVLRPGGCAWFGYHGFPSGGEEVRQDFWLGGYGESGCLRNAPQVVDAMTKSEMELFGVNEYEDHSMYSILFCKKKQPYVGDSR